MASRRGYVTRTEVDELTGLDTGSSDLQISVAEELIDAYVGPQDKFLSVVVSGKASNGGANSLTLQSDQVTSYNVDYFEGCEIEIIGGTGKGSRYKITANTNQGVITTSGGTFDSTSVYRIYQLGKFPRRQDVFSDTKNSPYTYYKQIPEAVKRAVAAQVEYMIKMGDDFFRTDESYKQSESIDNYSYAMAQGSMGVSRLIAPKAKQLLRGITNRKGVILR